MKLYKSLQKFFNSIKPRNDINKALDWLKSNEI